MKIKDLIRELYYFEDEDEIFALYYDKEKDCEYECDIEVKGDAIPILILERKGEEKYVN